MAKWNRPVITTKGVQLLQSTLNGKILQLTDVKVSDINSLTDEMLPNLSQLDRIKKSVPITNIELIEDKLKVTAIINNEGERDGYELRVIGIYSHNDLFAVVTASNSDFIPPDMGDGVVTINFDLILSVDRNANFSIDYNSKALLKLSDLNSIVSREFAKKANITDVITDVKLVDRTIKVTKNGLVKDILLPEEVHDSTDTVAGKISKNSIRELINIEFTSRNYQSQIDYLTNNKLDKNKALTKEQVEALISMASYNDLKNDLTGFIEKEEKPTPEEHHHSETDPILDLTNEEAKQKLNTVEYCKDLLTNRADGGEAIVKDPRLRKIAFGSDIFMTVTVRNNKLIVQDIVHDINIFNDLLDNPVGRLYFFNDRQIKDHMIDITIFNSDMDAWFKNPNILEATLMAPNAMKIMDFNLKKRILKLFVEDESIRNNIRYAKELQKYVKQYNRSYIVSSFEKREFKKEDSPENLNNVLRDNMFGLVTLGAYNDGTDRECVMYNKDHKEITRGNIQQLNSSDEQYTINNCNAIAFEGYTFEQVSDGYACMVAYELKGV